MFYFDDDEVRALLAEAYDKNRLHWLMMLVSLCHGLRVSELLSLTPDDLEGRWLRCRRLKDGIPALQPLHKSSNPLFDEAGILPIHAHGIRQSSPESGRARLFDLSRQRLDQLIKEYGQSAGVHPDKCRWHSWRHTTAMMVFRETVSLGSVKNTLGHSSWDSSLIYLNETDAGKGIQGRDRALDAISA